MLRILSSAFILSLAVAFTSCNKSIGITSSTTGWPYDYKAGNAFRGSGGQASQVPPGMVEIPGWSFTVDDVEEFETANRRIRPNELNTRRTLSVNSFYMDQHEVRNIDWREYQSWLTAVYSNVAPEIIEKAKPDINAWTKGLSDNEPFLMNYFTHPSFNEYPVVCVSWEQAAAYCAWRSDRANELRLIKAGVIQAPNFRAIAEMTTLEAVENTVFSSKKFYTSQQDNLAKTYSGVYPDFRLPSEDEWEFAAYARKSTDLENKVRVYPWAEKSHGKLSRLQQSQQQAHYNQTGANINSNVFSRTVPVGSFAPNDFGLYNMAGNVNEWVFDQYTTRGTLNRIDSVDVLDTFLPEYHKSTDSRVYKGGSWKDPIFWLHPASRRYLDRNKSANDIGFRCAMTKIGTTNMKK
ncbi:MAG: SUMF1/EgtB/PvdO family nonheme iron enzyme [Paludibacter sp.]|nr:SUMF1/EgtB/PvdO family nonheme iron enzyme [Paludibacter sp.]MDD4427254.1 SUMF1/EgtB/PvdO family nonheme iron enzyme [Paludibacter sp.]